MLARSVGLNFQGFVALLASIRVRLSNFYTAVLVVATSFMRKRLNLIVQKLPLGQRPKGDPHILGTFQVKV